MATDAVGDWPLSIAEFESDTHDALHDSLPEEANVYNPVDVVGDADNERLRDAVAAVLADDAVGVAVVIAAPLLEMKGVPVVGVLPREPDLAGVTVADLADRLGIETLTDAPTDGAVERFPAGATGGEAALRSVRRGKAAAVITGGDRTDIHTAALEAPGVAYPVVTRGRCPPSTVPGRAAEKGVPVLLSTADTLSTPERAEEVVRSGRMHDVRAVGVMERPLTGHADVDVLLGDDYRSD